jgi:ribosomal protein L21E
VWAAIAREGLADAAGRASPVAAEARNGDFLVSVFFAVIKNNTKKWNKKGNGKCVAVSINVCLRKCTPGTYFYGKSGAAYRFQHSSAADAANTARDKPKTPSVIGFRSAHLYSTQSRKLKTVQIAKRMVLTP